MAEQNEQNDTNQNNKKQQQPQIKVFIGLPEGGDQLVAAGKEEGKYNVTVRLGQNLKPANKSVAVKVYANDTQIGNVLMVKDPTNQTIENVKLDSTTEVIFSVRRTGQDKPDDSLDPVNLSQIKRDESASKAKKRFEVIVGPLTSSNKNPVTFVTYDENFVKAPGTVIFSLGQSANINGADVDEDHIHTSETGDGSTATLPLGRCSVVIKLNSEDTTVTFTHVDSGEVIEESLLFEP